MSLSHILSDLRSVVDAGRPLVVAGVGCGLTATGAVEGGADILATYSTAVYRRSGLPSILSFLPYDNVNALTFQAAPEILMNAGGRPVLLGIGAHDPRRPIKFHLDRVEQIGAAGIMNEPFAGIYGREIRMELSRVGLGFEQEVELIACAADRGLLTLGWAFSADEARQMASAGAHLIGAMLGLTGAGRASMDQALQTTNAIADAALDVNPEALVLAHGGLLGTAPVVAEFLERSRAHGYVTGSSAERQPVITAVAEAVRAFKQTRSP